MLFICIKTLGNTFKGDDGDYRYQQSNSRMKVVVMGGKSAK